MKFIFNDGGREAAGYKGQVNDYVVRAIAIATGKLYDEVYRELRALCKKEKPSKTRAGTSSPRSGIHSVTYRPYLESLGWVWYPKMLVGKGCEVHLSADELPKRPLDCQSK